MKAPSSVRPGMLREVWLLVWAQASEGIRVRLGIALLLMLVASALTALGPVALKAVIDGIVDHAKVGFYSILVWIGIFVLSQWIGRCAGELRSLIYTRAERRMCSMLSSTLFAHLLRLPLRFHLKSRAGALVQSMTNGAQGYASVLRTLVLSLLPVLVELGTVVAVLAKLAQATFLALFCGAMACYLVAYRRAVSKSWTAALEASSAQVDCAGTMTDTIQSYETIKYFAAEPLAEERVERALVRTEQELSGYAGQYAVMGVSAATIYALFLAAIIVLGVREAMAGRISIGTLVLLTSYVGQITKPLEALGGAVQTLSQGIASMGKMLDLMSEKREADDVKFPSVHPSVNTPPPFRDSNRLEEPTPGGMSFDGIGKAPLAAGRGIRGSTSNDDGADPTRIWSPLRGELEFRDVWFSYDSGEPVLQGVSFKIIAGRTLGVVGRTGSGKSTLVRLVGGLLRPDSGVILIDGVPLEQWPLKALRQSLAVVEQNTRLLDDTIGWNIALGRPECSQAEIEAAAKVARIDEFIEGLPDRYATRVGQGGGRLSGGERQRVCIARAALLRPKILLVDEGTSAVDMRTESEIVSTFEQVSQYTTTLLIAHRLSTLAKADEIMVLENGQVIEHGTSEGLLARKSRYATLWADQHREPSVGTFHGLKREEHQDTSFGG